MKEIKVTLLLDTTEYAKDLTDGDWGRAVQTDLEGSSIYNAEGKPLAVIDSVDID